MSKAKAAISSTISLIHKLKLNSWDIFNKLFDSLISSILLYASPLYAIRHLDELEKIQLNFYKRLMNLPFCTPNYAVRLEAGRPHLGVKIFKLVMNWIIYVLAMPNNRYPKVCLSKQISLRNMTKKFLNTIGRVKYKKHFLTQ